MQSGGWSVRWQGF